MKVKELIKKLQKFDPNSDLIDESGTLINFEEIYVVEDI